MVRRKIKTRTRIVKMASRRRSKRGMLGGLGINLKTAAIGGAALMGVKIARPYLIDLGNYNAAAESVIAGVAMGAMKLDNKDLISAGIKQGVAQLGADLLQGRLPNLMGNGSTATTSEGV